MSAPAWYAVHTNARKEPLVDRLLKHQGFDTLFLHFTNIVKHAGRSSQVIRPYFNRYLFTYGYTDIDVAGRYSQPTRQHLRNLPNDRL